MVASKGSINLKEIAYDLPYAQGLQFIWDAKISNQETVVARVQKTSSKTIKGKFKKLLG